MVEEGVQDGETVVLYPPDTLKDGARVIVKPAAPRAATR
jgi:SOS-response transcriptional repressor LexA